MARAEDVLRKFRERYKDDACGSLGGGVPTPRRVRSGVLEFDVNTGGGWPAGRMSILAGGEDTGKSLLLYVTLATYLEDHPGMKAALMDLEGNYSSEWGRAIGIDEDRLLFLQPSYGEQGADMIAALISEAHDVGFIGTDSLAQLVSTKELEKDAEEAVVGTSGLLISRLQKKTCSLLVEARKVREPPTVVYINQFRSKIGVMHGDPRTMPGGNAPRYYAAMIVYMSGGKEVVDADVHPTQPAIKQLAGTLKKRKGAIVNRTFESDVALIARPGVKVGRSVDDWKLVGKYFGQLGLMARQGKGWQILGHEHRTQKECREWYEANRAAAQAVLFERLLGDPKLVAQVEGDAESD